MHERSLVQGILTQVTSAIVPQDPRRVRQVTLEIGEFAGVEPLLLQSAFDELAPEVFHPTVTLSWQTATLRGRCQQCRHEFAIEQFAFVCPLCAGPDVQILSGEQLVLVSVGLLPEDFE